MANITKPNFNNALWASGGAVVAPSDVKIATGWTAEVPPFQWENYSQNRQDQGIAHILQHGISVHDTITEYQAGTSFVQGSNGKVYVAIQTHTNQNPVTDTSEVYWADFTKPGYVVINTTGVTSFTVPPILKLGLKKALVTVIAGGGGGAKRTVIPGPGGGGGGGIAVKLCDLTGVTSVSVTVGVGGAGATVDGNNGVAGGSSSFGAFCAAGGGAAGTFTGSYALGGVGTSGDVNYTIGNGNVAIGKSTNTGFLGGAGGGSESIFAETDSGTPLGAGQGGGGRNLSNAASGANGRIIISW